MLNSIKDSNNLLASKYLYKLSTNSITLISNIIIQLFVPRFLGPKNYGIYHFLFSFFQQSISFGELGTTQGYLTKLSKRKEEKQIVAFYFLFIISISCLLIVLVILSQLTGFYKVVWPQQQLIYIYFSLFVGLLFWYSYFLMNTSDALGYTIKTEKVRIFQKILASIILLLMIFFNKLNLFNYFLFNLFTLGILVLHLSFVLFSNKSNSIKLYITNPKIKKYVNEFYIFSKPLFLLGFVGTLVVLLDRWLLQAYYGSEEQGFFGIAFQLSYVCLLFSTAMTPLITREFSIAYHEKNIDKLYLTFKKYIPAIYSLVAFISCFIAFNSSSIILIIAGRSFIEASLVVTILSFYPIHQVYGQLGGSMFMATERTNVYSKIGIFTLIPGIPIVFILIGPEQLGFYNLGAVGIAIKMVIIQIVSVNIQLFYLSRFLDLNFLRMFLMQFFVVLLFSTISFCSKIISNYLISFQTQMEFNLIITLVIYCLICFSLLIIKPSIFGIRKNIFKI